MLRRLANAAEAATPSVVHPWSAVQADLPTTTPAVSIVVPLYNEADNVALLVESITTSLTVLPGGYEIILVDDGSTDATWERVREAAANAHVRGIRFRQNAGQTAAMMAGFDRARGRTIVSLDGDLQNDPRDIPMLVAKLDEGYDLVCGWRQRRQDGLILRQLPSICANRIIRWLSGVPIRDNGCSLKAYRRDLLERLHLYADQHRFIPALSASWGASITELPVRHHARRYGRSKYGISRTAKVLADLLTLKMITSFRHRPLVGFGIAALAPLVLGGVFTNLWLIAFLTFSPEKANAFVLPTTALVLLGAALYLAMLGLVAEVAVRHDRVEAGHQPVAREW